MANLYIFINADSISGGDGKVKVTNLDTVGEFLDDTLTLGSSKLTKTIQNPGLNERLQLDVDQSQIDHDQLLNFVDAEHKPLIDGTTTTDNVWSADKIQTELDLKQDLSEKGNANGYASLDGGGKLPVSQLPTSAMEYKGAWNPATNTPTLADGVGDTGDQYRASAVGSVDLGSGLQSFAVGDLVIYNGTIWEKAPATDSVLSVFSRTGDVTAQASDYDADQIDYDNATSGLTATDAQAAIDEVEGRLDTAETGLSDHLSDAVDAHDASAISYVNTTSGLTATDAQGAIDEVDADLDAHIADAVDAHDASAISYVNTTSGMTATDAQAAIDELDSRVDSTEGSASQVKVSANDTTDKYLESAIVASNGVNSTNALEASTLNDGADEDLQIQFDETKVDHDQLANFVSNEHIDHSGVNINTNADSGLSGGGDITASRTLTVDIAGTTAESTTDGADELLIYDTSAGALRSMTRSDFLSGLSTTSDGDIPETSFSLVNDQSTPAVITGFAFSNVTVRSFQALVSVAVDATADLYEEVELQGIQKGSSWEISQSSVGDDSLVDFDINTSGQLTYTTPDYAGFVSGTLKFRSITTSV